MKDQLIRVLVADDHAPTRRGIVKVLASSEGIQVVGEAENVEGVVALAGEKRPGVVLLDEKLPTMSTAEVIARIHEVSSPSGVVIMAMYDDSRLVNRLTRLGAEGFVLKTASREELASAVRVAAREEARASLSISREAMHAAKERTARTPTARELEVLLLASRGLDDTQVASSLRISGGTVRRHLDNIFAKLEVTSRAEATTKAISVGWVTARELENHHD